AHVDRRFEGDNLTLLATRLVRLLVLLNEVDALDDDSLLLGKGLLDLPRGTLVLTGDDDNLVALLDLHRLEHLRRQRNDAHELLVSQFTADRAENTGAPRVPTVLDEPGGVLIEADVGAVGPTAFLRGAHDNGFDDVALLDPRAGQGVLDGRHNRVTDARVPPARAAKDTDGQQLLRTRVVGDLESRLLLNHVCS